MEKLFIGKRIYSARPLQHARILNELLELRDQAVDAKWEGAQAPVDDLGLDQAKSKRKPKTVLVENQIVTVNVADVDGSRHDVNIFALNKKTPLAVELTPANIELLQRIINHQISEAEANEAHGKRQRAGTGEKHIMWNEAAQAFRVLYTVEGKQHQKSICVTEERDKDAALLAAIEFRNQNCELAK